MGSEEWDGGFQPLLITYAAPNHFSLSFWALPTHSTVSQLGCPQRTGFGTSAGTIPLPSLLCLGMLGAGWGPYARTPRLTLLSPARLPGEGSSPPCQRFQLSVQAPSLHPPFISLGLKTKSWCPCRAEKTVSPVQSVTKVTRKLLQCNQKG